MRLFRHLFIALVIALSVPALSSAESGDAVPTDAVPAATAKQGVPKYLRIPVFFVTDRNTAPESTATRPQFGTHRQYLSHCKHDYALGSATITIKNTQGKPLSQIAQQLGWKDDTEKSEGYREGDLLTGASHAELKDKFLSRLLADAQKTPDHQALMFVPGYMSTFDSGLISAARFAYYAERPVVLFSWASKGEFKAYSADEATIEWCQYHFNDLLRAIQTMSQKDSDFKLRLVAHSMGTRLPVRASDRFPGATFCNEVTLVCPDVDDGVVSHYLGDATVLKAGEGAPTVRLYISRKDKMLGLSQRVHGGYERTGKQKELDPRLMTEGQQEDLSAPPTDDEKAVAFVAATEVPDEATGNGAQSADLKRIKDAPGTNLGKVDDRFQMIDFTAIDTGKVGHKIPVEIICNVSSTGEPGEGWKLVGERPMSGGSASSLVSDAPPEAADPEVMKGEPPKAYFLLVSTAPPARGPIKRVVRGRPHLLPKPLKNKDWTLK